MKTKISTIFLAVTTGLLLIGAIYISFLLKQEPGQQAATTIKKTKAASKTYLLAFNINPPSISPTDNPIDLNVTSPATSPTATVVPTNTLETTVTVSPTEILLARNNLTPTTTASANLTVSPTKPASLPETGWTQYSLILFAVSATVFFLAFIF